MSFIDNHPNYKDYNSIEEYSYFDVPYSAWRELESLIAKAGADGSLQEVVQRIATESGAGTIYNGLAYASIPDVVSTIRSKVKDGRFYVFMDCLAILGDYGDLQLTDLNVFLEDNKIGYMAERSGWTNKIEWVKVENEVEDSNGKLEKNDEDANAKNIYDARMGEKTNSMNDKINKIFITHSSKDKEYVVILCDLLKKMNIPKENIICTSDSRYKIPNGESTYVWLKKQFMKSNLHMIFVLSRNYFKSLPCLNEMGAAWLMAEKTDLLLLPGFGFSELKKYECCLDKNIQGVSIDSGDRELKAWLANLKKDILEEFGIGSIDELEWEDDRDEFIKKMKAVVYEDNSNINSGLEENLYKPVVGKEDVGNIPIDSAFLLVYAAYGDGKIIISRKSDGVVEVFVSEKQFMKEKTQREMARWKEALDRLVEWGWVRPTNNNSNIFELTGTGYEKADFLKEGMGIDVDNEPLEELKEFE